MFELELHELPYVYTGGVLIVILLAYWIHNSRRTHRERLALRNVVRCRVCAFQFRDETAVEFPVCPRCKSLVERKPVSRI